MSRNSPASVRPTITILLSTYNGEQFLKAQLESFTAQRYTNWVLLWRDDGSSDATTAIMRDFTASNPGRCTQAASSGPHLGAAESFLTLLRESHGAEMVAFSDQDDVWLADKLQHAMESLRFAGNEPALYCARQYLVDAALRGTKLSALHDNTPGFPASLTQNIANGNTLVMNAPAATLVAALGRPEGTVHDWWSYIVVSACGGRIIYDQRPQVLYRLHKNNLIGSARPLPARALAAIRRGPKIFMTMMHRHADILASSANQLTPQARHDLKTIQSALQGGVIPRLAALRCTRFRRRTLLENLLFSLWFITEKPAATRAANNFGRMPGQIAPEPDDLRLNRPAIQSQT
ncbi:glycosyl transferase family 2 [Acidocella aquatica]|uniref:Glycosyl transferase family 2 n=1 Tax=Acidocella aquatica TaxID=1922313 RepID=A0ABQ6AAX4_9PROT|nr:glycosyltransferase [Acidocella aquatica]GLR67936.1 glycosyl transferase family 2 [Acidocella aquatica]